MASHDSGPDARSSIALLISTALAMAWANSPWRESYAQLWATTVGGGWSLQRLVNDGLMTLFFFVVGLELRRELHDGVLADFRRALLPVAAALGGMVVPALVFLALNSGATARGWGVPMATDIAFAVGVLALLGKRVPPALRVLLLALAVIDDVGAIVVIALFYSGGIHPTLAGVALGMLLPPSRARWQVPLERAVTWGVMPLFAFANAGVPLGTVSFSGDSAAVFSGVAVGLVLGKPLGILGASWLCVRAGWAALPAGVRFSGVAVVGLAGGIGFTMAIFIAQLAFQEPALLDAARLAVLTGSFVAAATGLIAGRVLSMFSAGDGR